MGDGDGQGRREKGRRGGMGREEGKEWQLRAIFCPCAGWCGYEKMLISRYVCV